MKIVKSVRGVLIRLTPERLAHIEARHIEMKGEENRILQTVTEPDFVQAGDSSTLIAIKHYEKTPLTRKYCSVVYRELNENDGFVLTAYFTSRPASWRKVVWKL